MTTKPKSRKSHKFSDDPFFSREKEKYAAPIPSREHILSVLGELGCPVSYKRLIELLDITSTEDTKALGFRLKAMIRDAQLMQDRRGRYCLLKRLTLASGHIIAHPDGFGFFVPDDGSKDWFISPEEMRAVMHNDRVLVRHVGQDNRGRDLGKVHEVVERQHLTVAGTLVKEKDLYFLKPSNRRLSQLIYLPREYNKKKWPEVGTVVVAEIIEYPTKAFQAIGRVQQVLGESNAPGMEIEIAIHAHQLPLEWSNEVLKAAKKIAKSGVPSMAKCQKEGRQDLQHLSFVTIDGEDAKDFDDAVYAERKKSGWNLWVAIADVSHYVQPDTALDTEACLRGNSVYFPGRVIPMLPPELSDDLCSLKPEVPRLCFVAQMSISEAGLLERYRFYRAVICSKARLTYTDVGRVLETNDTTHPHYESLEVLASLYHACQKAREKRGALEFETTETRIVFDEQKKIQSITPVVRNVAHRLIEEMMLMANVAAARFIKKHQIPAVLRVHEPPNPEKLQNLQEFLS